MAGHHGQSTAAWTGIAVALLGFLVGGGALMLDPMNMIGFWIGIGLLIIAFPLWWLLAKMGMG